MKPIEFRFKKNREFSEAILPATKYGEEYIVLRQRREDELFDIDGELHANGKVYYYIIGDESQVIGRFGVSGDLNWCGITYHIVPEFQNRGIGQTALRFVVDEIFANGVERIIVLAVNDRSVAIASKVGFTQKSKRVFELKQLDYQQLNANSRTK